ncbi:hypothetical protein [Erwinia sp. 198]|uniref:hypothetical protein n=1 Tax=Erwinia sp. 198 TaxID=2022746 RepID=UPI000F67BFBA|nr:hypothetical protein [Erwinia sp. 198]
MENSLAAWLTAFMLPADATPSVTHCTGIRPAKIKPTRIISNGDIMANKSLEFIDVPDKLPYASPELKEITRYIDSYDGKMDSGYLLYLVNKKCGYAHYGL